jgi:hypothetical protein
MAEQSSRPRLRPKDTPRQESVIRRSWHAMTDLFSPFSSSALASLPRLARPARYLRADAIPDTQQDEDGQRPTVRDYHAINSLPEQVRVPKKIATPVRVEGKVWFANERSECDYGPFFIAQLLLIDVAYTKPGFPGSTLRY